EVDEDQLTLLALIDAEDALARGDAKSAREALAKRADEETGPLLALALSYDAEVALALGSKDTARSAARQGLAMQEGQSHHLAKARAEWVLAVLDHDSAALERARSLVPATTRFSRRVK